MLCEELHWFCAYGTFRAITHVRTDELDSVNKEAIDLAVQEG